MGRQAQKPKCTASEFLSSCPPPLPDLSCHPEVPSAPFSQYPVFTDHRLAVPGFLRMCFTCFYFGCSGDAVAVLQALCSCGA